MTFKIRMIDRKREFKKPDEFISAVDRLTEMAQVYRKRLLWIVGLLVVVGGAVGGVFLYQYKQEGWAAAIEFEAAGYYHQSVASALDEQGDPPLKEENLKKAIDLYQEVVARYPRTRSAALSQYYIGNSYLELGNHDQAVVAYQDFIQRYSQFPLFIALVQQRLAFAYLGKGNLENAKEAFKDAAALEGAFNRDQVLYELGRLYETEGKKEEAIQWYQKIKEDHPDSVFTAEASVRLRGLGVVEVEPSPSDDKTQDSPTATIEIPPADPAEETSKENQ